MEGRETGAKKLKHTLDKYLEVNDFIFQSDKKLKEIVKIANNAIICQGLILNNTLHGYLDVVTSEDSMKNNSNEEIVKVCAEIFDLNRDILTLIELEISEDCASFAEEGTCKICKNSYAEGQVANKLYSRTDKCSHW